MDNNKSDADKAKEAMGQAGIPTEGMTVDNSNVEPQRIFCNSECGDQHCTLLSQCEKLQMYLKQQAQINSIRHQNAVQVMTLVYRAPKEENSGARYARLDKDPEKIIMVAATLTQKIFEEGAGTLALGISQMLESEYEKIEKKG